jgi:hypothetical protein
MVLTVGLESAVFKSRGWNNLMTKLFAHLWYRALVTGQSVHFAAFMCVCSVQSQARQSDKANLGLRVYYNPRVNPKGRPFRTKP